MLCYLIFIPDYNTAIDHNHDLSHTDIRLAMTKRKYNVHLNNNNYYI